MQGVPQRRARALALALHFTHELFKVTTEPLQLGVGERRAAVACCVVGYRERGLFKRHGHGRVVCLVQLRQKRGGIVLRSMDPAGPSVNSYVGSRHLCGKRTPPRPFPGFKHQNPQFLVIVRLQDRERRGKPCNTCPDDHDRAFSVTLRCHGCHRLWIGLSKYNCKRRQMQTRSICHNPLFFSHEFNSNTIL